VERFFILINLGTFIAVEDVLENITIKKAGKIISLAIGVKDVDPRFN